MSLPREAQTGKSFGVSNYRFSYTVIRHRPLQSAVHATIVAHSEKIARVSVTDVTEPQDAYSVQDWREVNDPHWPEWLWCTIPAGMAIPALFSGAWLLTALCLVLAVAGYGIGKARGLEPSPAYAYPQDIRDGDYPPISYALVFVPVVIPILSTGFADIYGDLDSWSLDSLGDIPAMDVVGPALGGAINGTLLLLGRVMAARRQTKIARRRNRRALASGSLEGVTVKRIECVNEHRRLVNALVAAHCAPGVAMNVKQLARFMDLATEELRTPLRELERAGIVKLEGSSIYRDPREWTVSFTEDGVRSIDATKNR